MAGNGLDERWPIRIIAQDIPNLPDTFVDAMLEVDKSIAAPDRVLDLLSGDQLSGVACQQFQQLQSVGRQFYSLAVSTQLLGPQINLEGGKP